MPNQRSFSVAARWRSVHFAVRGLRDMLQAHHNARIHAAATIAAVLASACLRLTAADWCFVTFAIMAVWMAEAFNTACEYLVDVASPDQHPIAGKAKDAAAAAVLIASIGAAVIGLMIFVPQVMAIWRER